MGLVDPQHVGSSQTRAQTRVPCIGRWILNHCTIREVQFLIVWLICVLVCFSLDISCMDKSSALPGLDWLFPILEKFSTIICSNIFSVPFFFSSSSGTPIIRMLVHLMLSQKSLRLSSILFVLFFLFLEWSWILYICSLESDVLFISSIQWFLCKSYSHYVSIWKRKW